MIYAGETPGPSTLAVGADRGFLANGLCRAGYDERSANITRVSVSRRGEPTPEKANGPRRSRSMRENPLSSRNPRAGLAGPLFSTRLSDNWFEGQPAGWPNLTNPPDCSPPHRCTNTTEKTDIPHGSRKYEIIYTRSREKTSAAILVDLNKRPTP